MCDLHEAIYAYMHECIDVVCICSLPLPQDVNVPVFRLPQNIEIRFRLRSFRNEGTRGCRNLGQRRTSTDLRMREARHRATLEGRSQKAERILPSPF
jgi:hypothetical protein